MDLDGDGLISLYEMEWFYTEIEQKLLAKNMETLGLRDVICNLLDSVTPANANPYVTLNDLKRCGLAHRFFNTFVNYLKYLEQESSEGERASVKVYFFKFGTNIKIYRYPEIKKCRIGKLFVLLSMKY